MPVYRVGSLFAGVGGICLGFRNARTEDSCYELKWANEIDEFACETYRTNFEHNLLEGDIVKILEPAVVDKEIREMSVQIRNTTDKNEREVLSEKLRILQKNREAEFAKYTRLHEQILNHPIDILTGGFPCQAFSIAGEQQGFDDPRGNLFFSIVNLIKQLSERHNSKPRVLFLENVKNLKSHDKGQTYKVIQNRLRRQGYTIYEKVLNTMDFTDLPQNRERIYIIGFRDKEDAKKFKIFEANNIEVNRVYRTAEQRQEDVRRIIDYDLSMVDSEKYYYTRAKYPHYFMTEEEFAHTDRENRINLEEQVDEMYQFYQCRRGQYVRKNQKGVCPTLTANMGTGGHNVPLIRVRDGIRKITPEEAFKLQGFPVGAGYMLPTIYKGSAYSDSHLYKQAGNAVSVPMIQMLALEILNILESEDVLND